MAILGVIFAAVALVVSIVAFISQRKVFLQLVQIRAALKLDDELRFAEISVAKGRRPSSFGLPTELDGPGEHYLLVLSATCATCHSIAAMLSSGLPDDLWVLMEDRGETELELDPELASLYGLASPRVMSDKNEGAIAASMGIATSPLLLKIHQGVFEDGFVLSSARQLWRLLPERSRVG